MQGRLIDGFQIFRSGSIYRKDWARAQIEAEQDVAAAEAAEEALAQNGPEEEAASASVVTTV